MPAQQAISQSPASCREADGACQACDAEQAVCRRAWLSELRRGECGVIAGARVEAGDAAYLAALGLRTDTRVRMCSCGDMCIVAAGGRGASRIGLARGLARQIEVVVE